MTRLIIADDHTLFRVGLRQMLQSFEGVEVVAEAANAEQTLAVLAQVATDALISDLTMPGVTGTGLIESVRKHYPQLPILVLSMHDEPSTVRRALQAGATGYLTKEASPDLLHAAVEKIVTGQRYLPPELSELLALESLQAKPSAHANLSLREREVFQLIATGKSLALIAEQLHLSPKTITTHKTHLMEKLGVENNAELIRYALEHKLFD